MSERGNALFLILIGVALFAALSYAITQSGRGGGNINAQTALIMAGQVTEEPADVRAAFTRMVLSGVSQNTITFSGSDSSTNVFGQSLGGGATDVPPPSGACNTPTDCASWLYVPAFAAGFSGNFVSGLALGGSGSDAFAILGAGTATGTSNPGLGLTATVCTAIQKGLGYASPYTPPTMTTLVLWLQTSIGYNGSGNAATVHDAGNVTSDQDFACILNASGTLYNYYAVLYDQ